MCLGQYLALGEHPPQRVLCKSPAMVSRLKSSARSTGKKIMSTWRDAMRSDDAAGKRVRRIG